MTAGRVLRWDGFFNTRDLGGLPTRSGHTTRRGAFVRSAGPRFVTAAGWSAAREFGIRTVVDLRNDNEIRDDTPPPDARPMSGGLAATGVGTPPDIDRFEVPLDDIEDVEFWDRVRREQINGTPLYYRPFLDSKAHRCAAVITTLARARPGGVLYHCGIGRDRTGLITLLLLSLADVEPEAIADDYDLSTTLLPELFGLLGVDDQGPYIRASLDRRGTSIQTAVLDLLDDFDAEGYLRDAGVAAADLDTVRDRLVGNGTP